MNSTATTPNRASVHEPEFPFTRGARVGLFLLMILTVTFAAGLLFVKYQLESFRAEVERGVKKRFGAHMTMGEVSVNGLRGLSIENFKLDIASDNGPTMTLMAPTALINISLNDLLYGDIIVDRILLDGAHILIERPEGAPWYTPQAPRIDKTLPLQIEDGEPFRITGSDCLLEIRNIVGDTQLQIESFRFDVARLPDATDLTAHLEGNLSNDPEKHIALKLNFASMEDFDLHVQTELITAEDVNVVLPSPQPLVSAGTAQATLWVNGRPGKTLLVSLQMPFENIVLRDHPEFLDPATGLLTFNATYATDSHLLSVSTAKAVSNQLSGDVDGTIQFGQAYPELNLHLHATRIPVKEILAYALEGEFDEYGTLEMSLQEPHELEITLQGSSEQPVVHARATAGSGYFKFLPSDEDYPSVSLTLGQMQGSWDSETQDLMLAFDVTDGDLYHGPSGLEAHGLSGTVTHVQDRLSISPLNATVTDNAFVCDLSYDLASGDAEVTVEGTLARIEDTIFADAIKDTLLRGAATIKGHVTREGDLISIDAELDITQTQVDYQWWFTKPAGVGASGRIWGEATLGESIRFSAEGRVASSSLAANVELGYAEGKARKWFIRSIEATAESLDVNGLAKCLNVPYRITGGAGRLGHFEYVRDPADFNRVHQKMGCVVDDFTILALSEDALPISGTEVTIEVNMDTFVDRSPGSTGAISVNSRKLSVPPLGTTWFVALEPPPQWPLHNRSWTYALESDLIDLPPWKGADFTGQAFSNPSKTGFNWYQVSIDGGRLHGNYIGTRADNSYTAKVDWTDVPAHYFLEHLKYPKVLRGTISGEVSWFLDQDDPGTINGSGFFEVTDGEFSADFLYSILEGQVEDDIGALPPDLSFSHFYSEVLFKQDTVQTQNFKLESETIQLTGYGEYIHDGDMNYHIELAVDPYTAERMPLMAENFNIQFYKLMNQDIPLSFNVVGPTFRPRGEVAELPPVRVTLLGGAVEVGREVIDFPRKILRDLLKTGGGIVGAGTSD